MLRSRIMGCYRAGTSVVIYLASFDRRFYLTTQVPCKLSLCWLSLEIVLRTNNPTSLFRDVYRVDVLTRSHTPHGRLHHQDQARSHQLHCYQQGSWLMAIGDEPLCVWDCNCPTAFLWFAKVVFYWYLRFNLVI